MKKIILISFFALAMMAFVTNSFGQQRPSQRSFTSVMSEVNQKQAARNKMMQQIKQATPSNTLSNVAPVAVRPTAAPSAQLPAQKSQQTSQQPLNNKQKSVQPKSIIKPNKE